MSIPEPHLEIKEDVDVDQRTNEDVDVDQHNNDDDDPPTRPRRNRTMTEKGLEYTLKNLRDDRHRLFKRTHRRGRALDSAIATGDIQEIEETAQQFKETTILFEQSHTKLNQMLPPQDKEKDEEWFNEADEEIAIKKRAVYNRLRQLREMEDSKSLKSRSSSSQKSHSCSNTSSRRSAATSKSRRSESTIKDRLLKEQLRVAELHTDENLYTERKNLEDKGKVFDYKREIALSKARIEVLQGLSSPERNHLPPFHVNAIDAKLSSANQQRDTYKDHDLTNDLPEAKGPLLPRTSPAQLRGAIKQSASAAAQHARTTAPEDSSLQIAPTNNDLGAILCKMLQQQQAPIVDVERFDGEPTTFNYFYATFQEVVEKKIEDPRGRLTRLIKFTGGEARDAIRHCIQLPPERGYRDAIKLLKERFGDPHLIQASYRNQIRNMAPLHFNHPKGFRDFLNNITRWQSFTCDDASTFDSPETIRLLIEKLPPPMTDRWNRRVMTLRRSISKEPSLKDFITFMEQETCLVNDPLYSRSAIGYSRQPYKEKPQEHQRNNRMKSAATSNDRTPGGHLCPFCSSAHDPEACPDILSKTIEERSEAVRKKKLCFGCLKPMTPQHNASTCTNRRICSVCHSKHATILHGFKFRPKREDFKGGGKQYERVDPTISNDKNVNACTTSSKSVKIISMCAVPVVIYHKSSNKRIKTMAMLDSCSQASFITENLVRRLEVTGVSTSLSIRTVNGTENTKSSIIQGLRVRSSHDDLPTADVIISKAYTREELPVDAEEIANKSILKRWSYLEPIAPYLPSTSEEPVEILIGGDCLKAIEPVEVIPSEPGGPYAYRSILGWCIVGPLNSVRSSEITCNRISMQERENTQSNPHFEVKTNVIKEDIEDMFREMYETDFVERLKPTVSQFDDSQMTDDERRFLKIMQDGTTIADGHYTLPLPFKNEKPDLPNNRSVAEKRLHHLYRKFKKDDQFYQHYKTFIKTLLEKGHATKSTTPAIPGKTWYLPTPSRCLSPEQARKS